VAMLEVKKTADGRVLARRKDGQPLTPEDREQARRMAGTERFPADITDGQIVAVRICSHVLEADFWLALSPDFNPDDDLAIFYPDELPFLKDKNPETLKEIHRVKLQLGGGRVRQ
jgi:hypothetical protein